MSWLVYLGPGVAALLLGFDVEDGWQNTGFGQETRLFYLRLVPKDWGSCFAVGRVVLRDKKD